MSNRLICFICKGKVSDSADPGVLIDGRGMAHLRHPGVHEEYLRQKKEKEDAKATRL